MVLYNGHAAKIDDVKDMYYVRMQLIHHACFTDYLGTS
jgi:hypothetical protein